MDTPTIEEIRSIGGKSSKLLGHLDQIKVPGFHPSMSMSDLVNHIEHCIAEQVTSDNSIFSGIKQHRRDILEITQYLFSETQSTSAFDEQIDEAVAEAAQESKPTEKFPATDGESNDFSGCKQALAMTRKDSFAELLVNLPRIASLPQFLFSLPEDSDYQAR